MFNNVHVVIPVLLSRALTGQEIYGQRDSFANGRSALAFSLAKRESGYINY